MIDTGPELPLTEAQTGIWLGENSSPGAAATYLWGEYTDLVGELRTDLLTTALRQVVRECEAINVVFTSSSYGNPRQQVSQRIIYPFPLVELRDEASPEKLALALMRTELDRPLDLSEDPLFGGTIFRLARDRHLLFLWAHHIALDGVGMTLVSQRIAEIYGCLCSGEPVPGNGWGSLRALSAEEHTYRQSAEFAADATQWQSTMAGGPGYSSLAPHPAAAASSSLRLTTTLTETEFSRVRVAAEAAGQRWSRH